MRYLAGYVGQIGDSLSFGIGSTAAALTDTDLDFEIYNVKVVQVGIDVAARKLIYKVTIPADVIGTFKEVCLWSGKQAQPGLNSQDVITSLNQAAEIWAGGTWDTGSKINNSTYRIDAATSGTTVAYNNALNKDLGGITLQDKIVLAYQAVANTASIRIDVGTDSANRYSTVVNNSGTGYKIVEIPVANFTKTGNPDWSNVTYIAFSLTANSSGAGSVKVDGMRINRAITDGVLVSRQVLSTEIVKENSAPLDAEYIMAVTV